MIDQEKIHEDVREHYRQIVETRSSSCCGDTAEDDCGCGLYDVSLIETIPGDIASLSLGCGDPVTIASIKAGETVLDLGSGAGLDCFLAAKQVGESGHVIGIDMTDAMLKKANDNKQRLGLPHVEFRKGQIEAMPVDDGQVDLIISNCVINLSPDKASIFQEAYRVLKPGGRLSVSDIVTDGEFTDAMQADMDQWSACVSGAISQDVYVGLMQAAGFVDIKVVDKSDASDMVTRPDDMPRIFSARITARKPE